MDKNIKNSDANGPLARVGPSMDRGLRNDHLLVRLISHATADPPLPRRQGMSTWVVLSLLLAFVSAGVLINGEFAGSGEEMARPLIPGARSYFSGGTIGSPEGRPVAAITPAGKVLIAGGTVIPLFPKSGQWTESAGNTSDRYESRHFVYMVPGEAPAIELFVTRDRKAEPPDGTFEMGLVKGFLSGFAATAGFKFNSPVFRDRMLGPAKIKQTLVKLTSERGTLWVHAYIYPRKPSLTFIAIRAQYGAQADIEKYLAALELK